MIIKAYLSDFSILHKSLVSFADPNRALLLPKLNHTCKPLDKNAFLNGHKVIC